MPAPSAWGETYARATGFTLGFARHDGAHGGPFTELSTGLDHIGFVAASPEQADAFHAAGVAHGGVSCEEPPGYREAPTGRLYLAYVRDPDGNKLCVLHRPPKPAAAH